jgi:hypothetical protein
MLAKQATIEDFTDDILVTNTADSKFDSAIAQQDSRTGSEFTGEVRKRCRDPRFVARHFIGRDRYGGAGLQEDGFALFEQACADFGTLQILQNANRASFALSGATQALDAVGVIFMRAMGEIEAGNIHPTSQQVAHLRFGTAGGTDRADNFGSTTNGA